MNTGISLNRIGSKRVLVANAAWKASIPIIESCSRLGYEILAIAPFRFFESGFCNGVIRKIRCPDPVNDPAGFTAAVIETLKCNECEIVLPVGHLETKLLAEAQEEIRSLSEIFIPPYDTFLKGLSKSRTMRAAAQVGCPIPRTWFPSEEPIGRIAEDVEYPVIIKPAVSASSKGLLICNRKEDLIKGYPLIAHDFGECLVQEYIPQTGTQYKCAVICDSNHQVVSAITYEKIRYYPVDGGFSTLNKSLLKPELIDWAMRVSEYLQWVGPCDFDWITDPRDNSIRLMEINPRFSETFKMSSVAGLDMTKTLLELARGESASGKTAFNENIYLRYLVADMLWFLTVGSKRWNAKPSFFHFFGKDLHYLEFGHKNLKPLLGFFLKNVESLLRSMRR